MSCYIINVINNVSLNYIMLYMSQVLKLGYKGNVAVCAWWGKGDRSGMLADVQVSWPNYNVHL